MNCAKAPHRDNSNGEEVLHNPKRAIDWPTSGHVIPNGCVSYEWCLRVSRARFRGLVL